MIAANLPRIVMQSVIDSLIQKMAKKVPHVLRLAGLVHGWFLLADRTGTLIPWRNFGDFGCIF